MLHISGLPPLPARRSHVSPSPSSSSSLSTMASPGREVVRHRACDFCRHRKVACSKELAGCMRCTKDNVDCVYSAQKPMGRPRKKPSTNPSSGPRLGPRPGPESRPTVSPAPSASSLPHGSTSPDFSRAAAAADCTTAPAPGTTTSTTAAAIAPCAFTAAPLATAPHIASDVSPGRHPIDVSSVPHLYHSPNLQGPGIASPNNLLGGALEDPSFPHVDDGSNSSSFSGATSASQSLASLHPLGILGFPNGYDFSTADIGSSHSRNRSQDYGYSYAAQDQSQQPPQHSTPPTFSPTLSPPARIFNSPNSVFLPFSECVCRHEMETSIEILRSLPMASSTNPASAAQIIRNCLDVALSLGCNVCNPSSQLLQSPSFLSSVEANMDVNMALRSAETTRLLCSLVVTLCNTYASLRRLPNLNPNTTAMSPQPAPFMQFSSQINCPSSWGWNLGWDWGWDWGLEDVLRQGLRRVLQGLKDREQQQQQYSGRAPGPEDSGWRQQYLSMIRAVQEALERAGL
ncbi:hypothetical protein CFIMG_003995RA [Ceratocystis fimbriata CBS 114723]|uniref:Zn(2)-C6 fungal-type domain-containing protein n=1 Tax=Ceratocystis fimbriata CBS 114723 TaxID=1035309 RepID=A0A2C5WP67_9PEZI|nr:hypothetical protein CFIMG_003995RA [Ceratocystis fimbriata CBS 114723]